MNVLEMQMRAMVEALQTPAGLIYVALLVLVAVLTVGMRAMRWVLVSAAIYVSTFGYSGQSSNLVLSFPLNDLRLYSRGISGLLLLFLLIPTVRSQLGWRFHVVSLGILFYFVFQLVISARMIAGGDFTRGYWGTITYTLTFLTFGLGLTRWLQTIEDVHSAIRAVAVAGLLFVVGSFYQWQVRPASIVWGGRFFGTSGNANHAGLVLATALPPACYMLIRARTRARDTGRRQSLWPRLMWGATTAMLIVMLLWTGSRTAAVVAMFSIVLLFRLRLGRLLVASVVIGTFVYIALGILQEAGIGSTALRLLDVSDTRTAVWLHMFNEFKNNPVFGISAAEAQFSENSYLLVASRTGLVGLFPFFISVTLVISGLLRLQRLRARLGEHALLADFVTAGICGLALGAVFEGYLFATYSMPLFVLFIYGGLLSFLLDYAEARAAGLVPGEASDPVMPRETEPEYGYAPPAYPSAPPQYF